MATHRIIVLKAVYKDRIKKDPMLAAAIASKLDKSTDSIKRWRLVNHRSLVAPATLEIIRKHLGLPASEVLTEEIECEVNGKISHAVAYPQAPAC